MKINSVNTLSFKRRPQNIEDFHNTLLDGKKKIGNTGKSILIIPTASLPNSIGVGNLASKEGADFINFAKTYWGINELQLLPTGRFFLRNDKCAIYSGTSLDLGSHIINIKDFVDEKEYKNLIKTNLNNNIVNYENIIKPHSEQEIILWRLFKNMPEILKNEFVNHNFVDNEIIERKSIYNALSKINNSHDYNKWSELDKNLFNSDIIKDIDREKRIAEIYTIEKEQINFFKFKQFLAEKSLSKAKNELNSKGMKLNGDMIINFSNDEIWSYPKAFYKNSKSKWGMKPINLESIEGENLLRKKVQIYAKRFDGFRIDASWMYANQIVDDTHNYYSDKYLNMIDEEVLKIKGKNYDLANIMHEFIASPEDFRMFNGEKLKNYINQRNKIFTADYLSSTWGSNYNYLQRGWDKENFVIGMTNHDSKGITQNFEQIQVLSEILKIPVEKLKNKTEFIKAKFAESFASYNNMIYFKDALSLNGDYTRIVIPENYEKMYFDNLEKGIGFNPMDALEKNFIAKGLDKTEPELFKKIVKYNRMLQGKNDKLSKAIKIILGLVLVSLFALANFKIIKSCKKSKKP